MSVLKKFVFYIQFENINVSTVLNHVTLAIPVKEGSGFKGIQSRDLCDTCKGILSFNEIQ